MNRLVKNGNDRYDIINETGAIIACIVKDYMGTHGHWRGYQHHVFCEKLGKMLWAGVTASFVYPEAKRDPWLRWTDEPQYFGNLKEVREHYGIQA